MSNSFGSYETTFLVRDHCLCLHAQRAARALARRFDDVFRPLGITSGQFSLLTSLHRPNAPSIASVARLLAMDRTTLTANLKPLERRGLVRTEIDPADRRGRLLTLTDAGRALLRSANPIWVATHAEVEGGLTGASAADLRAGLRDLSDRRPTSSTAA